MEYICKSCGHVYTTKITNCEDKKCNGVVVIRQETTSVNSGKAFGKKGVNRTHSQVFIEKMSDGIERIKLVGQTKKIQKLSKNPEEHVWVSNNIARINSIKAEREKTLLKAKRTKTKNFTIALNIAERKKAYNWAFKKAFNQEQTAGLETMALFENLVGIEEEYIQNSQQRDAPQQVPGIYRRGSFDFDNGDKNMSYDWREDYKRPILGTLYPKSKLLLDKIITTAVLSVDGVDEMKRCNGYTAQIASKVQSNSPWEKKYNEGMIMNYSTQKRVDYRTWITDALKLRARPDLIVLLEGVPQPNLDSTTTLTINGTTYTRAHTTNGEPSKSTQNVTGWIRNDTELKKNLEMTIQKLPVLDRNTNTTLYTDMAVIKHTVEKTTYYELVCHLPNDHAKYYSATSDIKTWYSDNIEQLAKKLNIQATDIVNVMGDTNLNVEYDTLWSPAPSFGGDIHNMGGILKGEKYYALPSSSADTSKFMRQMCNVNVNWLTTKIRIHRASYLNHTAVREGTGMTHKWVTDHPSFMSYTSIYTQ